MSCHAVTSSTSSWHRATPCMSRWRSEIAAERVSFRSAATAWISSRFSGMVGCGVAAVGLEEGESFRSVMGDHEEHSEA